MFAFTARLLWCVVAAGVPAAGAAQRPEPARPPAGAVGWARLSSVAPGTPVVVVLSDGRRLSRHIVRADDLGLAVLDVSGVRSRSRRQAVVAQVRDDPERFVDRFAIEEDGRRVPVVERFDRLSVVMVARPRPWALERAVPSWFFLPLVYSGPCPSCDAAQTWNGATPLPSPLGRTATEGEVLYAAAPNPLDTVGWPQIQQWLPTSLRGVR